MLICSALCPNLAAKLKRNAVFYKHDTTNTRKLVDFGVHFDLRMVIGRKLCAVSRLKIDEAIMLRAVVLKHCASTKKC